MRSSHPLAGTVTLCIVSTLTTATAQRVIRTHLGDAPFDEFGVAVSAAPDFDGDGIGDYLASSMADPGAPTSGYVRVHSSRDGSEILTIRDGSGSGEFGAAACGIGDLDSDGHPDVLIGVPTRPGSGSSGEVVAYSGTTGFAIRSYRVTNTQRLGASVCALGDVDRDGVDDFVATAPGSNDVVVVSGLSGTALRRLPSGGLAYGREACLAVAGDVDGDGDADFIVGDPNTNGGSVGNVWVYSGRNGRTIFHEVRNDQSLVGTSVAAAGDVDNDGRDDFLVGTENALDPSTGYRGGLVTVYSGRTLLPLHTIHGDPRLATAFGANVVGVGDLNLDGHDDFAGVSTRYGGYVQVFSGRTGAEIATIFGPRDGAQFGGAIARLGDLDGDGLDELLIGARYDDPRAVRQGAAFVYSMRILARSEELGTGCGGGPFVPELGATRPILGRSALIVGRDVPASATAGLLFVGQPLRAPFEFGVPGCSVHVDIGTAAMVTLPGTSSWSLSLPLPPLGAMAGVQVALQSVYAPTTGVLGFDLSNGVLWRLGH